jgi:acetoacetate decarboxylase
MSKYNARIGKQVTLSELMDTLVHPSPYNAAVGKQYKTREELEAAYNAPKKEFKLKAVPPPHIAAFQAVQNLQSYENIDVSLEEGLITLTQNGQIIGEPFKPEHSAKIFAAFILPKKGETFSDEQLQARKAVTEKLAAFKDTHLNKVYYADVRRATIVIHAPGKNQEGMAVEI